MASVSRTQDPATFVVGNRRVSVVEVTMDSSYPTGGEALTAADFGLSKVDFAISSVKTISGTVNIASAYYDITNSKLKVYDETPGEVANTADLSSVVLQVIAWGRP